MTAPLLRFAHYRDIAADVGKRLAAGGVEAIVASNGVGSAIAEAAVRGAVGGAVSLRLPTIEAFARAIVNDAGEYPRIATDAEQRFAMRSASRLAADRILDTQALGAMLHRSYRDVRDAGISVDDIESRVRSLRNRRRAEAMLRAWREYERLIAAIGAVDPADVLARAATLIRDGARVSPQIVAGFYDMTGAQLAIVNALATARSLAAVYVPTAEHDEFSRPFVAQLPQMPAEPLEPMLHVRQAATSIAQYENKSVELQEACRAIASLIAAGAKPHSIAIVARSFGTYDIRLLHRFANELGFAIAAAESMPLTGHRIGRAVVTLLRLRNRNFMRSAVIDLLRDGFKLSCIIDIDAVDDATRRARIAGGSGNALHHVPDYAAAVAEIETLAPSVPLSGRDWAALLRAIVGRFRIETDRDELAANAIDEIAAMLGRAHAWNRRFDAESIADIVNESVLTIAPPPAAAAVWAGDVMRFRGRTFDHVFAVRMQDDVFPQRRTDDPLLSDSDRRALGIREIGDGAAEERLLFRLVQDGASTALRFTLAATDGLGKLLRPSALLKQFAIEREPSRRAEILRDFGGQFAQKASPDEQRAARPQIVRQLQRIARAGSESVFDGYLEAAPELRALSPTALEDFGECPQKFLWKHILGVRDLDEPELELHVNARDKGKIDHTILERFYRSLAETDIVAAPRLASKLRERLHELVDEEFDAFEAKMPPFNPAMRAIERRATKRHLESFVVADLADLAASGFRPAQFEYAFGPRFANADHAEAFVIAAHSVPMSIEGRIDRIDENQERLRVIDYKSGKAGRHQDLAKKIDRGVRIQLALYAMAVAEFFGRDERSISGAIKPLRGGKDAKFSFDLANHAPRLRETLDLFARAILSGRFPAFPNENDDQFNSCKYCPVNHSCRTKHDDAEKYAVTRHEDARTLLAR